MASLFLALLRNDLRRWLSARGVWLAVAAAAIPVVLTGAWALTHQADVAVTSVTWEPASPVVGDNVTITATFENVGRVRASSFNATVVVGRLFGNQIQVDDDERVAVPSLASGSTREVSLSWVAKPGLFWVLGDADPENELAEIEEFNNQRPLPLLVGQAMPGASSGPMAPRDLSGNDTSTLEADLVVLDLRWRRVDGDVSGPLGRGVRLNSGDNVTFSASVENRGPDDIESANITLRVGTLAGTTLIARATEQRNVSVPAGESVTVFLEWTARDGVYWVQAYADGTDSSRDPAAENNHAAAPLVVDAVLPPEFTLPEPPERLTIKDFYSNVIQGIQLRLVLPFIALFYAIGVLADERASGSLSHMLTRPVPRWMLPVVRFLSGFVVAALAVSVGVLASFALLFGAPGGDAAFLLTPLVVNIAALAAYGAFFVLLGVMLDSRPFLAGIGFVLGWETAAPLLVPWVRNATINQHLIDLFLGWGSDETFRWIPEEEGLTALRNLAIASVAFLVVAAYWMKRREFPEA